MSQNKKKTILIVGTNMMNIYHHRLELIKALLPFYNVVVAAPRGGEEKKLEDIGCRFVHIAVDNRGTNIIRDLRLMKNLRTLYQRENPDVILTFYTKTNIYGGLVARSLNIPYISTICGLGTSLASDGLLSKIMIMLYREAVKRAHVLFFQNTSNREFFLGRGIYAGRHDLLPGSGVSLERHSLYPYPEPKGLKFLFASRILKEKGIDEYIGAAKRIRKEYPDSKFYVVGPAEEYYENILNKAHEEGDIVYLGKLPEVGNILEEVHCNILPSYYPEGMANILLESAASGRPVITTSLPGCRETVDHEVTGFIVNPGDVDHLTDTVRKFIKMDHSHKKEMGLAGRRKMEKEFDRKIVTARYLEEIKNLIGI